MATPKHRLQITFTASETPNRPANPKGEAWKFEEREFHFDSDMALCQPQDHYFEGHSDDVTGHCFYSWMQPTPYGQPELSLRVFWWEVQKGGKEWVAGFVGNESMEAPLGRLRGKLRVTIPGWYEPGTAFVTSDPTAEPPPPADKVLEIEGATLSDENGCCFSFGDPIPWPDLRKLQWYLNRLRKDSPKPPEYFWVGQPCPDARGGDSWNNGWTPFPVNLKNPDGSWVTPKYWNTSDPRNPPIGVNIGESKVANWYDRQTHSHYREGGEGFRSPWETGFLAAGRLNDPSLQVGILGSLWDYVRAQVGGMSPTGQGYVDGRPNHLSKLDGTLFQAGVKYGLTPVDQAAPFTAVLHEGRPQIGKAGLQFWECFGRNDLHPLEVTQSQFKGLYGLPNGSDFEHCASGPLAAAAILYGDPLAQRQLHHICEEHLSQGQPLHSTRSSSGWFLVDLADGYLCFQGNSTFGPDAERYREGAFGMATTCWQKRFDLTPYQGMLSVGYEYFNPSVPEKDQPLYEATMQLSIALHAASVWYQLEGQSGRKAFWQALGDYIVDCLAQPGVIDWSRGGIIQRYALQTPHAVPGGPSASELVEQYAPANYRSREILSAEGWCVPALAEWWLATSSQKAHDMAQEGYRVQITKIVGPNNQTIYSPGQWSAWGQNHAAVVAFGWTA